MGDTDIFGDMGLVAEIQLPRRVDQDVRRTVACEGENHRGSDAYIALRDGFQRHRSRFGTAAGERGIYAELCCGIAG